MSKKYRLLENLPYREAGTIFVFLPGERKSEDRYVPELGLHDIVFLPDIIETNPEWFAPVEDKPAWKPVKGEVIEVRAGEKYEWGVDRFVEFTCTGYYVCMGGNWKYARPLPREPVGMFVEKDDDSYVLCKNRNSRLQGCSVNISDTLARQLLGDRYPLQPGQVKEV